MLKITKSPDKPAFVRSKSKKLAFRKNNNNGGFNEFDSNNMEFDSNNMEFAKKSKK